MKDRFGKEIKVGDIVIFDRTQVEKDGRYVAFNHGQYCEVTDVFEEGKLIELRGCDEFGERFSQLVQADDIIVPRHPVCSKWIEYVSPRVSDEDFNSNTFHDFLLMYDNKEMGCTSWNGYIDHCNAPSCYDCHRLSHKKVGELDAKGKMDTQESKQDTKEEPLSEEITDEKVSEVEKTQEETKMELYQIGTKGYMEFKEEEDVYYGISKSGFNNRLEIIDVNLDCDDYLTKDEKGFIWFIPFDRFVRVEDDMSMTKKIEEEQEFIFTRRFADKENRLVFFKEGEHVKLLDKIRKADDFVEVVNLKSSKSQMVKAKDLIGLNESYYDYCERVFGKDLTYTACGCPSEYGFSEDCSGSCADCYAGSFYVRCDTTELEEEPFPEKITDEKVPEAETKEEEVDLRPTEDFNVGDTVEVLDGSNIEQYRGTFVDLMKEYIGTTQKVESIDKETDGRVGITLEGINFIWDARGLKKVVECNEIDENPPTKKEVKKYGLDWKFVLDILRQGEALTYGYVKDAYKQAIEFIEDNKGE